MQMSADHPNAKAWTVIDRDTGEEIPDVKWADDDIGEYEQYAKREDGSYIVLEPEIGPHSLATVFKRGNILFKQKP